ERYVYDPYGAVTYLTASWGSLSSSDYAWVYQHQGGRLDTLTGVYNFRYRDYSPTLGRSMQVEPLGFAAGDVNLYRYVGNQPTNRLDPSGLLVQTVPVAVGYLATYAVVGAATGATISFTAALVVTMVVVGAAAVLTAGVIAGYYIGDNYVWPGLINWINKADIDYLSS